MILLEKNAGQARVAAGVDLLRLADGEQHPFGRGGVNRRALLAQVQVFLQREFLRPALIEA